MAVWMNGAFIAQGVAFALAAALVVVAARPGPASAAFLGFAAVYGAGSASGRPVSERRHRKLRAGARQRRDGRDPRGQPRSPGPPALCLCSADDSVLGAGSVALAVAGLVSGAMLLCGSALQALGCSSAPAPGSAVRSTRSSAGNCWQPSRRCRSDGGRPRRIRNRIRQSGPDRARQLIGEHLDLAALSHRPGSRRRRHGGRSSGASTSATMSVSV